MKFLLVSIFAVIATTATAQRQYQKEWKRIDSLIDKAGLPKSALKEVNTIYNLARKENNEVQAIKALLYKLQLNDVISEQGKYENIALLEKEVAAAKEPAKSILHSIAGASYWHYMQLNRWQFYNRTNTKNYDNNDISTWTLEQLYSRITEHYEKSLSNTKELQQTKLTSYDPIIIKGNARFLRPTLYDLLAFRALDYYRNDERYITEPAYAFEIIDSAAFADAAKFVKHKFITNDTLSLHHRALQLYQELLAFHLNDADPSALIDANLDRLRFVQNFGKISNKDELFGKALNNLITKYSKHPFAANVYYEYAQWYMEKGATYDPIRDTTNRMAYVTAKKMIDAGIALKPSEDVLANLKNLSNQILLPSLTVRTETVNTIGEPFRALVTYKNVGRGYAQLVKLNTKIISDLGDDQYNERYWNKIIALPALKKFLVDLPATNDYQQHGVEIKMDALPAGEYGLLLGSTENFQSNSALTFQRFHVSDISFVSSGNKYYVVDRKSGAPLEKATVQLWTEYYNSAKQKNEYKKGESYVTDNQGYFALKNWSPNEYRGRIVFDMKHDRDFLFLDRYDYYAMYRPYDDQAPTVTEQIFMFTDRSVYRPGQTVYFKGILASKETKEQKSSVIANKSIKLFLRDANGEDADSISITSNEFGSVTGKFTLPTGVLSGQFSIHDEKNSFSYGFRVEEYKRPKFYVEVAAPKGTYRVDDTISVTGTATSYAGNKITGADVKYRVVRKLNIPYWGGYGYYPRIWPPRGNASVEITNGIATTDANGNFTVKFKAIPDLTIPKGDHPEFSYTISADVTDMNGETRTGATSMAVAYEALRISLGIPETLHVDSLNKLYISTTNINDSFESAKVDIALYKLAAPQKVFRSRLWQQPDQFILSRDEYYRLFPNDLYADEDNKDKWARGNKAIEISVNTTIEGTIAVNKKITEAGWYLLEAKTKDRYGDTVTARRYVMLHTDNKMASPVADVRMFADKSIAEKGEKVNYKLLTNVDSIFLLHEVLRSKDASKQISAQKGSSFASSVTINKSDNNMVYVKTMFVKNNRVYSRVLSINISQREKQLDIQYTTFRNKAEPGSKEKWTVKITGSKGEKVAAELLTGMYDQSLDEIANTVWGIDAGIYDGLDGGEYSGESNFASNESASRQIVQEYAEVKERIYDRFKSSDDGRFFVSGMLSGRVAGLAVSKARTGAPVAQDAAMSVAAPPSPQASNGAEREEFFSTDTTAPPINETSARKNLNETAFFFPTLRTDSAGNVEFSFTFPEAVTTWKWRLLAHTKDLATATGEKSIITQKQLMVQPNAPRFIREGDSISFSVKVVNITDKALSGQARLQLFDAETGKELTQVLNKINAIKSFSVSAQQSAPVSFAFKIPSSFTTPITWRVIAQSGSLSDGEENILPVLSNRLLVTESLPLHLRGEKTKTFSFDKLLKSGQSNTLKNHALTVEFTTNPAWYAVQALPYLAEEKNESAEQAFGRFYANALASQIANSSPRLKQILEKWRTTDTAAFLSNLQKNEELKSVLLQETPWVLEAKTEAHQKKNIALLFELSKVSDGLTTALARLETMQNPSGAFTWLPGGPDDRYMTQYIMTGIGHLKKLNAIPASTQEKMQNIASRALNYLDAVATRDYNNIVSKKKKVGTSFIGFEPVQYLYMRSFFAQNKLSANTAKANRYFLSTLSKDWVKQSTYMRALIALTLHRNGDKQTPKNIVAALKESSIDNEELGMYWKDVTAGYYWYQAPVETQAILIEAFDEITKDEKAVADLKTWLLKNKQTNSWKTSRATADACYALLLRGADWINDDATVTISLGDKQFSSDGQSEAGTGYFKKTISSETVTPSMGTVKVNMPDASPAKPAWGAVYWQYFEDLDNITSANTSLKINKKLFVQKNTDRGPVIEPLDNNNTLKVGDRVKVRIELRTDRNMEYVHLKDMRASSMEPVNVLSEYKWEGGLGYYEATKDASTNFFFNYLPKGVHIFEYDLFVTHTGRFSNGVATIQCLYAPEFTSHSEGIVVNVTDK